jgi:PAS domain S-box-containing protein
MSTGRSKETRSSTRLAAGTALLPMPIPLDARNVMLAFNLAPVGLCVARQRVIQACNNAFGAMFGFAPDDLTGRCLSVLYLSEQEFTRIGERAHSVMLDTGSYSDERIMRRRSGEWFWCHVSGQALDRHEPFDWAVWAFEDISTKRPVTARLTVREREIVQLLVTGKTSKQIARELSVSPRTIEGHRARLMHKFGVSTPGALISKLAGIA